MSTTKLEAHELVSTMDAQIWAEQFRIQYPQIPEDEALAWFANAIMAGYDQGQKQLRTEIRSGKSHEFHVRVTPA